MAKTKQELTDIFSAKLQNTIFQETTFADVLTELNALTTNQQNKFMTAVLQAKDEKVGRGIRELLVDAAKVKADAEATTAMTDDSLSLLELQRIFD